MENGKWKMENSNRKIAPCRSPLPPGEGHGQPYRPRGEGEARPLAPSTRLHAFEMENKKWKMENGKWKIQTARSRRPVPLSLRERATGSRIARGVRVKHPPSPQAPACMLSKWKIKNGKWKMENGKFKPQDRAVPFPSPSGRGPRAAVSPEG